MSNQTNVPTIEFLVYVALCHYRIHPITERLLTCIAMRAIGGAL